MELLDFPDHQEPWDNQDTVDLLDPWDPWEAPDLLDPQAPEVVMECKAPTDLWV